MTSEYYIDLILKKLKKSASGDELKELESWLLDGSDNVQLYGEICDIYQIFTAKNTNFIPDKGKAWEKISSRISTKTNQVTLQAIFRYAAASLIFFVLGFSLQYLLKEGPDKDFLNQYTTIIVQKGQKSKIILPDGSNVWINSGSTLRYKNSFNDERREVELNGEAFFEVEKDKSRLFKVNTGDSHVEVFGTAFNVRNYTDETKLEVTVENGNVVFIRNDKKISDLTMSQQLIFRKDSDKYTLVKNSRVDIMTAWKNDELIFDNTPLEEVIRYLEHWYGVNITIEERMKKKHCYTFKIKTETLRELLEYMKVMTPLTYKIDGKNVIIKYAN